VKENLCDVVMGWVGQELPQIVGRPSLFKIGPTLCLWLELDGEKSGSVKEKLAILFAQSW
jgi:hypothetical protein